MLTAYSMARLILLIEAHLIDVEVREVYRKSNVEVGVEVFCLYGFA